MAGFAHAVVAGNTEIAGKFAVAGKTGSYTWPATLRWAIASHAGPATLRWAIAGHAGLL